MKTIRTFAIACALTLLAACGSGVEDTTTTSTAAPTTTVATTSTTASTTTTVVESTTTTAGGSEATGDLSVLHAAMAGTSEAAPSRVEGTMTMSGLPADAGVEQIDIPFTVTTDPATGDSAFEMDFGAMATAMGGSEEVPAEMAELMGSMELRQIGDVVYMKFPFFTAFMGAETEWVSLPAEEGNDVTDDLGPGTTPSNPGGMLDSFADAEGEVEVVGDEEIRGIPTTHYRLLLDESWHDQLTDEELEALEEQGIAGDAAFPLDLWVGDDGLVHRMAMRIEAGQLEDGAEEDFEAMTMTFDFFDFGQSVTIEPPPADQVTDMEELGGGFGFPDS